MTERIWAAGMFKNEADIARHSLMHMVDQKVDGIIVADNLSTDDTRAEILKAAEYAESKGVHLELHIDDDPAYYQSRKTTALAERAVAEYGATWIIPFDADELWWMGTGPIGDALRDARSDVMELRGRITNYFPSAVDPSGDNPFETIQYHQPEPQHLPKVACRWLDGTIIEQGNHSVTRPNPVTLGSFGTMTCDIAHFPYRSFEQFKCKAENGLKAYEETDLPEDMGLHWRNYGRILRDYGEDALREVFSTYFWFYSPTDAGLVKGKAPFRQFATDSLGESESR